MGGSGIDPLSKLTNHKKLHTMKAKIYWTNGHITIMNSRPSETSEQFKARLLRNEIIIANKARIEYLVDNNQGYYIN
jgi:hypothetical protein